jgi:hypothetical protein
MVSFNIRSASIFVAESKKQFFYTGASVTILLAAYDWYCDGKGVFVKSKKLML